MPTSLYCVRGGADVLARSEPRFSFGKRDAFAVVGVMPSGAGSSSSFCSTRVRFGQRRHGLDIPAPIRA